MKKALILLALISFTILGCSSDSHTNTDVNSEQGYLPKNVKRIIDSGNQKLFSFEYENDVIVKNYLDFVLPLECCINDTSWIYVNDDLISIDDSVEQLEYNSQGKLITYTTVDFYAGDKYRVEFEYSNDMIYLRFFNGEPIIINGDIISWDFSFSHEGSLKIIDGNIVEKNISNQTIITYEYDDSESPFYNVENFEILQVLFSIRTSISPSIFLLDELWYGKNNIVKKTEIWIPDNSGIEVNYEYTYNTNDQPILIEKSSNSNNVPDNFLGYLEISY